MVDSTFDVKRQWHPPRLAFKTAACLLFSLFFALPHLVAQVHHVHHYSDSDGLPSNKVFGMAQSDDGRIWFSTTSGIVTFDGRHWNQVDRKKAVMGQVLAMDDRQRLWAVSLNSTRGGVSILDEAGWSEPIGWENRSAFSLLILKGQPNKALVGYADGLALIDIDQRTSTPVDLRDSDQQPIIFSLKRFRNRIYAGTNLGLMLVDLSVTRPELVPVEIGCSDSVKGLAIDSESDRMWLVGSDWIGRFDGERFKKIDAGFDDSICKLDYSITAEVSHGGQLIFGSWKSLFHYVPGKGITEIGYANGLIAEGANDLMLAQNGLLWVASVRGVSKIVSLAISNYTQRNGLYNSEVSAVLERADGSFVLGHVGGITLFKERPLKTVELGQGINSRVHDLAEDQSGNLWVAAYENGLVQIKSDGQIVNVSARADRLDQIQSVLVDGDDQLWVGANSGLKKRDGETFVDVSYPIDVKKPGIRKLFLDRQDRLIAAPFTRGLLRYDNGNWDYWTAIHGSPLNDVFAFLDRKNGQRLVGTAGGLCTIDGGKIVKLEHPRIDQPVYFIIEDQEQRIWCGTDKGVFRVDGETIEHFDIEHGLSGRETNRSAGHIDKKGHVWIGTSNGLSIYHPELDPRISNAPNLKFLQIKSGKEVWRPGQIQSLPYHHDALTFNYQAPSFYDESRIQVQSWMEGLEDDWQDPVRPMDWAIQYNFLPPGKYRLHLRAANAYGKWSNIVSTEEIRIYPPFWNTWWFYSVALVGVGLIGFFSHRFFAQRQYLGRLKGEVNARVAELEVFENRFGITLDSIEDGVLTIGLKGEVFFMNSAAERIIGLSLTDCKNRLLSEIFSVGDELGDSVTELMKNVRLGSNDWSSQQALQHVTSDGASVQIEMDTAPLRDGEQQLIGAVVVVRDVTEKIRLQTELANSHKLASLGTLAGGIAHDFNNLLAVINYNIGALQDESANTTRQDASGLIDEAIRQASKLTQQLLTFSHGGTPIIRSCCLKDLVRKCVSILTFDSNVRCELELAEDLWQVEIDVVQISQVFNNILINANQAMPSGGTIHVSARNRVDPNSDPTTGFVVLQIEDSGTGIPEDYIHRIFDPYFTTKETGSGIGLATAFSIIEQHRGKLSVESKPGIGSSFRIILPATAKTPGITLGETHHDAQLDPTQSNPILVVDDDPMIRKSMEAMLSAFGFRVFTAADGNEAVDIYEREYFGGQGFHAVLIDLTMPGESGCEIIQRLLRINRDVFGVVISGYSNDSVLAEYKRHGFKARLDKPCSADDILKVLTR